MNCCTSFISRRPLISALSMAPILVLLFFIHFSTSSIIKRDADGDDILACAAHPWGIWSECSANCGPGIHYRERNYQDPELAKLHNCEIILRETRECFGPSCGEVDEDDEDYKKCELTYWNDWSSCSSNCGHGVSVRERHYKNSDAFNYCQAKQPITLVETVECHGYDCDEDNTLTNEN